MYFKHVTLENWKNFRHAELEMRHRLFIIGPNASGKSNFLDIFRFLRDLSVSGGGLNQAVDVVRGGVSAIRCLAARRNPNVVIDVIVSEDDDRSEWRYRLSFSQDNNRRPIVTEEIVEHDGVEILKRPNNLDIADRVRLTETAVEQTIANHEFREVVQFFRSVNYQHLLPQVVRDPQGFSPAKIENDPYGRDFLQRVEQTKKGVKEGRLKKIIDALKVATPQLTSLDVTRDDFGVPHLTGMFEHWRPNGARQNERQFSDGTLRLFGLLWTLFEGQGPLLLEEPELSLHSEVVKHLPQMIERVARNRKIRRQIFVSTHSEDLLDDTGIGGEELVRLQPSPEGTDLIRGDADETDRRSLQNGMTVAQVLLPKSGPANSEQLALVF